MGYSQTRTATIDMETTAGLTKSQKRLLYREIATSAESGWDFSSRQMPDLLIAVSSSANALCNDGSLEGVKSKQGCDDLTEDGKQFSASWIVTLANVEHSSISVTKFQQSHTPEGHAMGGVSNAGSQTKDKGANGAHIDTI